MPLLFVPPTINKYYVLDISPGRSMIEHYVAPGAAGVRDLVAQPRAGPGPLRPRHLRGRRRRGARRGRVDHRADARSTWRPRARAGSSRPGLLGHLAASGELDEVASLTLMVCALDNDTEGTMSALASRDVAAAAVAESARKGYLDGQALAGVFTWLRPNDLVWNYVVNNYLLGKDPPAFDILYWNQDTVRLAAGLHRDFIHIGLDNSFVHPGALEVLGDAGRPRPGRPRHLLRGRASPITSCRGRARTRARGCSAASAGSCSRAAATSRRWSTRRARRAARSYQVADELPESRRSSSRRRRSCPGAGGRTGTAGWRSARVSSSTAPKSLGNRCP